MPDWQLFRTETSGRKKLQIGKKGHLKIVHFTPESIVHYTPDFIVQYSPEYSDEEPSDVVLSFAPYQGKYIKSTPLHSTQQILVDNEKELKIQLKVYLTHEFIAELLSFGDKMKILLPEELAKRVREEHLAAV